MLIALMTFLFVWALMFPELIVSCARYVATSEHGDGERNLYAYFYYILHNKGWLLFEGLNYPFGDHMFFTDNQPLLAWIVKAVNVVTPVTLEGALAFHNVFLWGSQVGSLLVLFAILQALKVPEIAAIAGSISIMLLSPQLPNLFEHFSLAHSIAFLIPWFLLIRYFREPRLALSVGIAICLLVVGTIHLYYLAIGSCMVALVWLSQLILQPHLFKDLRRWGHGLVQVSVAPLLKRRYHDIP